MTLQIKNKSELLSQYDKESLFSSIRTINDAAHFNNYTEQCQRNIKKDEYGLWMAENEKGELVAYAIVLLKPVKKGPTPPYLEYIATSQKGAKIGTCLLNGVCQALSKENFNQVTFKCGLEALGFYRKFAERVAVPLSVTQGTGFLTAIYTLSIPLIQFRLGERE